MARVKTISVKDSKKRFSCISTVKDMFDTPIRMGVTIHDFPNFHKSGSIKGMKEQYYGKDALLVRCGSYIYNVTLCPEIYEYAH